MARLVRLVPERPQAKPYGRLVHIALRQLHFAELQRDHVHDRAAFDRAVRRSRRLTRRGLPLAWRLGAPDCAR